jgi:hypothetical protein
MSRRQKEPHRKLSDAERSALELNSRSSGRTALVVVRAAEKGDQSAQNPRRCAHCQRNVPTLPRIGVKRMARSRVGAGPTASLPNEQGVRSKALTSAFLYPFGFRLTGVG